MGIVSQENSRLRATDLLNAWSAVSPSYGTFQGTALEFSRYCQEQFEAEVSLKGVLRKLVAMISSCVGVEEASFIPLTCNSAENGDQDVSTSFPGIAELPPKILSQAKESFILATKASPLEASSTVKLSVLGSDYWFAKFDKSQTVEGVLVWRTPESASKTAGVLISPQLPPASDILQFMVESAQQAARWLKRLDCAQSLLYQDEVTGLFNYRYLDVALDSEFRRLQRYHSPFSLLFIDLDNFKQVNDVHGHLTGSSILKQVGAQIKAALRDVDILIRYGGDEFVVVLIGTNSRQAHQAAERVRAHVDNFRFVAEGSAATIHVSTSIGVASCPDHAKDKYTLLRLADETMYVAKRDGKNRVVMVQSSPNPSHSRLTLARERN